MVVVQGPDDERDVCCCRCGCLAGTGGSCGWAGDGGEADGGGSVICEGGLDAQRRC